jgi:organic radical activating enzyme
MQAANMAGENNGPDRAGTDTSQRAPAKYHSCRFIERAATFLPGSITACCANPATGLAPVIASFSGAWSVTDLFAGRAEIIARHKRGDIVPECRGCPRLAESDWSSGQMGRYALNDITVTHFTSCNIRCNYCYTVTNPEMTAPLSKAPRILPAFEYLIEHRLLAPDATIRFSGGEPTLSPEFAPLLKLLNDYGCHTIVYTNGTRRSDAIVEAIKADKVELVIGIDAASAEVYKAIKKMNYNEKVWKVAAEYCAAVRPNAAKRIGGKFIFCHENFHEAELFVQRAEAAGFRHVYYDFDSSRRPGSGRTELPDEVADYVAVLRYECMRRGITAEFAESGLAWLTDERKVRVERKLEQLGRRHADIKSSQLVRQTAWLTPERVERFKHKVKQSRLVGDGSGIASSAPLAASPIVPPAERPLSRAPRRGPARQLSKADLLATIAAQAGLVSLPSGWARGRSASAQRPPVETTKTDAL